ncbi:hypothetical protein JKP88DRAFT_327204 [Tribonema minus]|uniref:Uncharacterized protein n=1 Tax=Tribonema minus TaxID=303371 RepID=A0A836CBF0_9STRA|nr:hypothetical protein JKP88DRAFT_327204 [Tribonema minus]
MTRNRTLSVTTLVLWALAALLMRAVAAPVAPACKAPPDIIDDHASAMNLTVAAACRGQNITVKWQGFVGLTEPIIVAAGTSLEINGVGTTDSEAAVISGRNETQLLRVQTGASVTLRNLRLRNGRALMVDNGGGGAARIFEGGVLLLEGCQFWFNRGERLLHRPRKGTLLLQIAEQYRLRSFTEASRLLGVVDSVDVATFKFNNLVGNETFPMEGSHLQHPLMFAAMFAATVTAVGGAEGGAVFNSGNVTSRSSTFDQNWANLGGAISSYGTFTCGNSTFTSNTATDFQGGSISNYGHFTCGNSTFTSNTANYGGGAIYNDGDFTCGNSTFTSNTANHDGGAINNKRTFTCGNSTFTSNTSTYSGGAISNGGDFTCDNSTFVSNTAENEGGAISNGGDFTCGNSTFTSNTATDSGGAINNGGDFTCGNSTFASNTATDNDGGAIYNHGMFTCDNSAFSFNKANYGGAICNVYNSGGAVTCSNSTFASNRALRWGGAIENGGDLTCSKSTFTSNTAGGAGGAIICFRNCTCGNSTFTSNTAKGAGGAIICFRNCTCGNSTFTSNTAKAIKGGTVYAAARSELWMSMVAIRDSDSHEDGAIFSAGNISISSSLFEYNSGGKGASIYLAQDASAKIKGTSFLFNDATQTGGALYLEAAVTGHIDDCKFVNNTSPVGGALSLAQADDARNFSLRNCVFTNNTASEGAGGAIIQQGTAMALGVDVDKDASFVDNVAQCCYDGRFRIPIVVLQVLTQYISITGLTLPLQYLEFLRAVDFMSLDMRWLTSPGCAADINFYGRLLIATLAPLLITALIFTPRFYLWIISRERHAVAPKLRQVVTRDVNAFLVFTFLIFSGVSLTVFQTFGCDKLKYTGKSYLRVDYSLECGDDEGLHSKISMYAAFMIVVYPVGIPVLYASILWRAAMRQRDRTQLPSRLASASSFLWRSYKGRAYYWEPVECLRRPMLAGLLVFIMPGSPAQSAVACMFAFFTAMVYEQVRPHQERMDK